MWENQTLTWKIEVRCKPTMHDATGLGISEDIMDLGISGVNSVRTAEVYWINGRLEIQEIEHICSKLLADTVTQDYVYASSENSVRPFPSQTGAWIIEVRFKPGVTDAVGDSVIKGVHDLGIWGVQAAHTGKKYWLQGDLTLSALESIAQRLLANEVIQTFEIRKETE